MLPRGGERRFSVFVIWTLRKHYRNFVHTMTKTLRAAVGVRTTFALSVFTFLSVLAISAHPCRRIKSLSNSYLPLPFRNYLFVHIFILFLFLHSLSSLSFYLSSSVKTLSEIFDSGGYQFSLDFRSSPARFAGYPSHTHSVQPLR